MAKNNILLRSKLKKARVFLESNDIQKAKLAFRKLYSTNKRNVDIALTLATIYRRLDEPNEALTICEDFLALDKNNVHALCIKGSALYTLNKIDKAIEYYNKTIAIEPKYIDAHYFLGISYLTENNIDAAAKSFENCIKINNEHIQSLTNLGAIRVTQRRFNDAIELLNKVLKIDSDCIQALCNLGNLHIDLNNLELAKKYSHRCLQIDNEFIDAHIVLAKLFLQTGEYDKSTEHFKIANGLNPDNANVIGLLAQTLELQQEYDAAAALIKPELKSNNSSILVANSSLSRHFNNEPKAIALIETALKNEAYSPHDEIQLHTELGKQYDKQGLYNKAFFAYRYANEIEEKLNANTSLPLPSTETTINNIQDWKSKYNKTYWSTIQNSGNHNDLPIFIVGMPRSGTTLIEQILSSHPDIYGGGEINFMGNIAYKYKKVKTDFKDPGYLESFTQDLFANTANEYTSLLKSIDNNAKRVTNKMPTDFWHIGLIHQLFPDAKIIHIKRNPIDTCLSIYFQRFGASLPFTNNLDSISQYYLSYAEIMEYWNFIFTDIKNIEYESLINSPEAVIRDLVQYCNLEWSDECLNFHKNKRNVNTPSYDQVRKPLYTSSVSRWKNYREHITGLIGTFNK